MIIEKIDGCTHMIGAPKDWDERVDGICGVLPARSEIDVQTGLHFFYSQWKPEPEDLALLNAGGSIQLGINCLTHPVVNMGVIPPVER